MEFTKADNGKTVHLKSGQTDFKVTLNENPTSGYVWELHKLPEGIQLKKSDRELSGAKLAGAAALRIFYFSIGKQAQGTLELKNGRPWDKSDTIDAFELHFSSHKK